MIFLKTVHYEKSDVSQIAQHVCTSEKILSSHLTNTVKTDVMAMPTLPLKRKKGAD